MFSQIKLIQITIVQLLLLSNSDAVIKKWIHDINYNNPQHWDTDRVPCPTEKTIFPFGLFAVIDLPKFLEFSTLVLPGSGALIMEENGKIGIGADENIIDLCKSRSGENSFKDVDSEPWFLSKNWRVLDGVTEVVNPAVPHQEIVPCDYDTVVFPEENSISVDLQDVPKVLFNRVSYRGLYRLHEFVDFTNTELGRMVIRNSDTTFLHGSNCYSHPDECACHTMIEEHGLIEALCENEAKFCRVPYCLDPIKPIGHCCEICGATLIVAAAKITEFNYIVKRFVDKNHKNEFYTHVSLVNINDTLQIQLIVLEKDEYQGTSIQFINDLKPLLKSKFKLEKMQLIGSGLPYHPTPNHMLLIIFGSLFLTCTFFFIMYIYYERDERLSLPKWMTGFSQNRLFSSPFVFARFENSAMENEFENVAVGIETPSVTDLTATSAFKNPIYDEAQPTSLNEAVTYKKEDSDTALEEINIIDNME